MTMRLSIINLAGMARTLVAVGTSSDADMFLTTAAAAPRSTCSSSSSAGGGVGALAGRAAIPLPAAVLTGGVGLAGSVVCGLADAGFAGAAAGADDPSPLVGAADGGSLVGSGL